VKLPVVSGFDRQTGSHVLLRHQDPPYRGLCLPQRHELGKGL
jgi:hypothetical protein